MIAICRRAVTPAKPFSAPVTVQVRHRAPIPELQSRVAWEKMDCLCESRGGVLGAGTARQE